MTLEGFTESKESLSLESGKLQFEKLNKFTLSSRSRLAFSLLIPILSIVGYMGMIQDSIERSVWSSCFLGAVSLVIKGHHLDAKTSPLARLTASMKNALRVPSSTTVLA